MGILSWLAETLDTQVRVDRAAVASLRAKYDEQFDLNGQLMMEIDTLNKSVNNLATKLGEAAKTITELRDHRKRLREELMTARAYIIDTTEDVEDEIAGLAVRSKKRAPLEATLAAINADLKKIADLLVETSK